jgi:hypothetical protein
MPRGCASACIVETSPANPIWYFRGDGSPYSFTVVFGTDIPDVEKRPIQVRERGIGAKSSTLTLREMTAGRPNWKR